MSAPNMPGEIRTADDSAELLDWLGSSGYIYFQRYDDETRAMLHSIRTCHRRGRNREWAGKTIREVIRLARSETEEHTRIVESIDRVLSKMAEGGDK